jgi:SAM-dependent methyltransferase
MLHACLDWARSLARRAARRLTAYRFDYVRLYAGADLARDHWSIVGPASREEFEQLGRAKLRALIEHGLTPSSRVLDVGCGTGQLTGPLAESLGPQGAYCGTDVAAEAVAFCKERFRRPNFRFLVNEMTRLPIVGESFDAVFLGSVFTHLYPAEVAALLKEVSRLLADDGFILADAFVTGAPSGHAGHRGMVRLSEATLRRAFADAGLSAREALTFPARRCRRVLYRLEHAT